MENKTLFSGILFLMFVITTNRITGQSIELEGVYIGCNKRVYNNIASYEPYSIEFTFRAINNTPDFLVIGADTRSESERSGYFEFETNTGEKFKLYSIGGIRYVHPNDTVDIWSEFPWIGIEKKTFLRQFKSKTELRDCIMKSRFSYTCIEKDYDSDVRKHIFRNQDVVLKNYYITFYDDSSGYGPKLVEGCWIEDGTIIELRPDISD